MERVPTNIELLSECVQVFFSLRIFVHNVSGIFFTRLDSERRLLLWLSQDLFASCTIHVVLMYILQVLFILSWKIVLFFARERCSILHLFVKYSIAAFLCMWNHKYIILMPLQHILALWYIYIYICVASLQKQSSCRQKWKWYNSRLKQKHFFN